MKKVFSSALLLLLALVSFGQILEPVHWDFQSKQVSDNEFDLIFTAKIDNGWTIYSQFLEGDDGPVPTAFYFEDKEKHYTKVGKVEESPENRKSIHDKVFDMELIKFYKKATFTQRVKVAEGKPITGYLEFMTCDDSRCLPPAEVDFSFPVSPTTKKNEEKSGASSAEKKVETGFVATQPTEKPGQATTVDDQPEEGGLLEPVKWSLELQPQANGTHALALKASIDKGWYVYSQFIEGEDGPEPTSVEFEEDPNVEILGKAEEVSDHKVAGFDKVFQMNVTKYKEEVTFLQKIKVTDVDKPVNGLVYFMTCDDSRCLPPVEVPFRAFLAKGMVQIGQDVLTDMGDGTTPEIVAGQDDISTFQIIEEKKAECGEVRESKEGKGLLGIFILGFLGGLVALLTPCVFPMIPLTVSFFTKSSEDKRKGLINAFMYGFYIFLVYLLLSLPFHLLDSVNPDILNEISTNVWLNIAFFVIFLFFAFSFFGYYELTLPSSWLNKSSSAEGIGGALGIFFMALTLALVSFSCTGPILGSLLAGALSSDGGAMQLTAGMGGFGLALALPFGLFAAFPSWLNSLPKSGGWMTTVKVVLGFLELALALKFLSNADLVKHWGMLKIEPFLALWILVFLGLGLYLFGKIRFPHDSPLKKVPLTRAILGVASFAFAIYLATGFTYDEKAGSLKPLKLLSGLAPPSCYSWLYPCDCPQNLNCFKDFYEGLAYAKENNKPIMIDFTGHACVNCRKMEEHVWPVQNVYKYIKDDFVLISLYVDEKIDLPESEQVVVPMKTGGTRKLRTTGHRWQYLQTEKFNTNTQPYYVLLAPDGTLLNTPVGYTPVSDEYANFLECGLNRFNELEAENKLLGDK